jgi:hypothetical protein
MMKNQVTVGQKIFVGFAISISFIVINEWISLEAFENIEEFGTQITHESIDNSDFDIEKMIADTNQVTQIGKRKVVMFAILGVVTTAMMAFLIARSIRPQSVVGNYDGMNRNNR